MFGNVAQEHETVVQTWQAALENSGPVGRKILQNFRADPRVVPAVEAKFRENLAANFTVSADPIEVIERCVTPDMVLQGPAAREDETRHFPSLYARVETIESWLTYRLTDGIWTGATADDVLKASPTSIAGGLPDEIGNPETGFVWIAEGNKIEQVHSRMSADELRDYLGLYLGYPKGSHLAVMVFPREALVSSRTGFDPTIPIIPTVIEGKGNPAFTPAPTGDNFSGRLIDLREEDPDKWHTVPEWVCEKIVKNRDLKVLPFDAPKSKTSRLCRDPADDFLARYDRMVN